MKLPKHTPTYTILRRDQKGIVAEYAFTVPSYATGLTKFRWEYLADDPFLVFDYYIDSIFQFKLKGDELEEYFAKAWECVERALKAQHALVARETAYKWFVARAKIAELLTEDPIQYLKKIPAIIKPQLINNSHDYDSCAVDFAYLAFLYHCLGITKPEYFKKAETLLQKSIKQPFDRVVDSGVQIADWMQQCKYNPSKVLLMTSKLELSLTSSYNNRKRKIDVLKQLITIAKKAKVAPVVKELEKSLKMV